MISCCHSLCPWETPLKPGGRADTLSPPAGPLQRGVLRAAPRCRRPRPTLWLWVGWASYTWARAAKGAMGWLRCECHSCSPLRTLPPLPLRPCPQPRPSALWTFHLNGITCQSQMVWWLLGAMVPAEDTAVAPPGRAAPLPPSAGDTFIHLVWLPEHQSGLLSRPQGSRSLWCPRSWLCPVAPSRGPAAGGSVAQWGEDRDR